MNLLDVADVGDGLCMGLGTLSGSVIQIDGGGRDSTIAVKGMQRIFSHLGSPNVFILSHFHVDHYNGLLKASAIRSSESRITDVFFPRIPEFAERRNFFQCLFAMNEWVFGNETGIMEYDFLKAISKMNGARIFRYRSLCRGENISINGSKFEVLWPPRIIEEKTLASVRRAIEDFNIAMEEDEEIGKAYRRLQESKTFGRYLQNEGIEPAIEPGPMDNLEPIAKRKKVPEIVKRANESLKRAANHLSLALFEDNRFLFLGDAESYEIRRIVEDLEAKGRTFFLTLITPHHGTHWHRSLARIDCINSLTSNGAGLCSRMKKEIKETFEVSRSTFANGDILFPDQFLPHCAR